MYATINTNALQSLCKYMHPIIPINASVIRIQSNEVPRKCENIHIQIFYIQVHIRRESHAYPENLKSLAIIIRAGHRRGRNTKI